MSKTDDEFTKTRLKETGAGLVAGCLVGFIIALAYTIAMIFTGSKYYGPSAGFIIQMTLAVAVAGGIAGFILGDSKIRLWHALVGFVAVTAVFIVIVLIGWVVDSAKGYYHPLSDIPLSILGAMVGFSPIGFLGGICFGPDTMNSLIGKVKDKMPAKLNKPRRKLFGSNETDTLPTVAVPNPMPFYDDDNGVSAPVADNMANSPSASDSQPTQVVTDSLLERDGVDYPFGMDGVHGYRQGDRIYYPGKSGSQQIVNGVVYDDNNFGRRIGTVDNNNTFYRDPTFHPSDDNRDYGYDSSSDSSNHDDNNSHSGWYDSDQDDNYDSHDSDADDGRNDYDSDRDDSHDDWNNGDSRYDYRGGDDDLPADRDGDGDADN